MICRWRGQRIVIVRCACVVMYRLLIMGVAASVYVLNACVLGRVRQRSCRRGQAGAKTEEQCNEPEPG